MYGLMEVCVGFCIRLDRNILAGYKILEGFLRQSTVCSPKKVQ